MPRKTVRLTFNQTESAAIARAIAAYAQAAYPPGGTECSQVAHETLLDTARQIDNHTGELEIRRRQLPMLKAAINWYFSPDGPEPEIDSQPYLAILDSDTQKR
ncbi:MAG: hypothetical protein PVG66_14075 [Chromatiales bacterium]|jgi:hypothetical protein